MGLPLRVMVAKKMNVDHVVKAHWCHAHPLGMQGHAARRVSGLETGLTWGLRLAECALQQVVAHAPKSSQLSYLSTAVLDSVYSPSLQARRFITATVWQ